MPNNITFSLLNFCFDLSLTPFGRYSSNPNQSLSHRCRTKGLWCDESCSPHHRRTLSSSGAPVWFRPPSGRSFFRKCGLLRRPNFAFRLLRRPDPPSFRWLVVWVLWTCLFSRVSLEFLRVFFSNSWGCVGCLDLSVWLPEEWVVVLYHCPLWVLRVLCSFVVFVCAVCDVLCLFRQSLFD